MKRMRERKERWIRLQLEFFSSAFYSQGKLPHLILKPHPKPHHLHLHSGCVSSNLFPDIFASRTVYSQNPVIPGPYVPRALYCHEFPLSLSLSSAWRVSRSTSAALVCCVLSPLRVILFVMAMCRCCVSCPVSTPSCQLCVT